MINSEDNIRKYFLGGIVLLCALIFGGLVWAIMAGPSPEQPGGRGDVIAGARFKDDNDPFFGPGESKAVVRNFGDFQCPACKTAEPGLKYAMKTYGDRVRFVWDDFPLSTIHRNARPSALAARCAEEQGKFWEYHDALYDEQEKWSVLDAPTQAFIGYAKNLGLDEDRFATCFASQTYLRKVQDDESEGQSNGVSGTPTFFIGDKRFVGGLTNAEWDAELQALLKK